MCKNVAQVAMLNCFEHAVRTTASRVWDFTAFRAGRCKLLSAVLLLPLQSLLIINQNVINSKSHIYLSIRRNATIKNIYLLIVVLFPIVIKVTHNVIPRKSLTFVRFLRCSNLIDSSLRFLSTLVLPGRFSEIISLFGLSIRHINASSALQFWLNPLDPVA